MRPVLRGTGEYLAALSISLLASRASGTAQILCDAASYRPDTCKGGGLEMLWTFIARAARSQQRVSDADVEAIHDVGAASAARLFHRLAA